jgi:hypothetical protein
VVFSKTGVRIIPWHGTNCMHVESAFDTLVCWSSSVRTTRFLAEATCSTGCMPSRHYVLCVLLLCDWMTSLHHSLHSRLHHSRIDAAETVTFVTNFTGRMSKKRFRVSWWWMVNLVN